MAGGQRLTPRALRTPLALSLAIVLVGHLLVLAWFQALPDTGPALKRVSDPIFTRLLAPVDPPAPTVPAAPPPPARTGVATGTSVTPAPAPAPETAPPTAPTPEPAASAPATAASAPPAEPVAAAAPVAPAAPQIAAPAVAPAASAPAAPADTWPPDTRLTYRLEGQWRGGPLYGNARVQWQRQGATYQAQVEIDIPPFTHRTLTSQGDVTPRALVPRLYEERARTRRRALRLGDTDIVLADGRTIPRPADLQDTASQFVELGHRFATGQHTLALGAAIPVWLARPGGVDLWTYDVIAQDLLQIPRLGEVMAWRLRPRPQTQRRDNLSAEIWFAPSLQYLPVRIRLTLGDEAEIDLRVDSVEQR